MRHTYRCPIRWADLDLLGHVNNVRYVDYLQEARISLLDEMDPAAAGQPIGSSLLADGVVVVRHEVSYLASLTYRSEPVLIDIWVTEVRAATFTMAYEIYDPAPDGGRIVYLRALTVLTPYDFATELPRRITAEERETLGKFVDEPLERTERIPMRPDDAGAHYPLLVRWSDVDAYRHVNNVMYFEYFQEARISYLRALAGIDEPWAPWVVAACDVDYRRPIMFRIEPYDVVTWVHHVGSSSIVLVSEIRDGDDLLARARVVMVNVDGNGRSTPMTESRRRRLLAETAG